MRPIYISANPPVNGTVAGPVVLDQYISPSNTTVTISNYAAGTTTTGNLFFTSDNVLDYSVANIIWQPYTAPPFANTGAFSIAGTGAIEAVFGQSPKAVRVVWGTQTGAVNAQVQVVQSGIGGS